MVAINDKWVIAECTVVFKGPLRKRIAFTGGFFDSEWLALTCLEALNLGAVIINAFIWIDGNRLENTAPPVNDQISIGCNRNFGSICWERLGAVFGPVANLMVGIFGVA